MRALADFIESSRAKILTAYERELQAMDSPISHDPDSRRQATARADQTVTDLVASLRGGKIDLDQHHRLLSWDHGTAQAAGGIHVSQSLRAAVALFEVTLSFTAEHLAQTESAGLLEFVSLVLNESINERIREVAVAHNSFLLNKIDAAHEEERRRIARELHDRISPGVVAAQRQLELYLESLPDPGDDSARIESAQEAIRETIDELRTTTSDLRYKEPLKGLENALHVFLEAVGHPTLHTRLGVHGDEAWVPPAVREESFLIIREAVRNSLSHGRPSMILVRVDIAPYELRASVEDDGIGFNLEDIDATAGLASMRERTALLGGTLSMSTQPGHGVQVELSVPLPGRRDETDQTTMSTS
ncbi:MAG TPA: histidine kinase [Streptosporangiaceae bacterium]|jgi:signal transduction histidine kinase|nr:histidine kinase [Streptosporangiaceae bacterium]